MAGKNSDIRIYQLVKNPAPRTRQTAKELEAKITERLPPLSNAVPKRVPPSGKGV